MIGNGVNESSSGKYWGTVLDNIATNCGLEHLEKTNKSFPVIYDEIFLRALRQKTGMSSKLKVLLLIPSGKLIPMNSMSAYGR